MPSSLVNISRVNLTTLASVSIFKVKVGVVAVGNSRTVRVGGEKTGFRVVCSDFSMIKLEEKILIQAHSTKLLAPTCDSIESSFGSCLKICGFLWEGTCDVSLRGISGVQKETNWRGWGGIIEFFFILGFPYIVWHTYLLACRKVWLIAKIIRSACLYSENAL